MKETKINLVLLTIMIDGNFSGVNRYLEMLKNGLRGNDHVVVHTVFLFEKQTMLFPRICVEEGRVEALIPFPLNPRPIIKEDYWMTGYSELVAGLLEPYFREKTNLIWNLHCIDLSRLAVILRKKLGGYILSYLHCIPWKFELESNPNNFNLHYRKWLNQDYTGFNDSRIEKLTYEVADHIVCVTQSARHYLEKCMAVPAKKISVVMNGIELDNQLAVPKKRNRADILYVGRVSREKGVVDLLKALRIVRRAGYNFRLIVAGSGHPLMLQDLKKKYSELELNFLGQVPFGELKDWYHACTLGVIPSLHEQCSYVGLEMAMFGVPLVVSDVDGLSEMFEHRVTALKVPLCFCDELGVSVDIQKLTEAIICLLENPELREKLSFCVNRHFREHFISEIMMKHTLDIYDKIMG